MHQTIHWPPGQPLRSTTAHLSKRLGGGGDDSSLIGITVALAATLSLAGLSLSLAGLALALALLALTGLALALALLALGGLALLSLALAALLSLALLGLGLVGVELVTDDLGGLDLSAGVDDGGLDGLGLGADDERVSLSGGDGERSDVGAGEESGEEDLGKHLDGWSLEKKLLCWRTRSEW
ncbi:hypothetical protein B0T14DRAFT_192621 [Immersiella caudata]|uniref:Uncharacterized protein n=1 Tax=Immersiella caudata TaxID=314043 RepID=A0AA39WYQ3_9PEZI|nr:hypothetical protein B0T14DRAFT_192621 [Immersiella caudata]